MSHPLARKLSRAEGRKDQKISITGGRRMSAAAKQSMLENLPAVDASSTLKR
jgi:hypothetical protein